MDMIDIEYHTDGPRYTTGPNSYEGDQNDSFNSPSSDDKSQVPKAEDPLSEQIIRVSLQKLQMSGSELIHMSVKDLNKRLCNCPTFVVSKLKRCRRTLKNRGYAKNCRIKRIAAKTELEQINTKMMRENMDLRHRIKFLSDQVYNLQESIRTLNARTVSELAPNDQSNDYHAIPCTCDIPQQINMHGPPPRDQIGYYQQSLACSSKGSGDPALFPVIDQEFTSLVSEIDQDQTTASYQSNWS